jgi:hypothetical protein
MKRLVVLSILCLAMGLAPGGRAQEAPAQKPTQPKLPALADIEAWITDNLPPRVDDKHRRNVIEVETQEIAFQGCTARFTDTFVKYKNNDRPPNKRGVTTTTIDLAKLTPESVVVFPGDPAVQIRSQQGVTTHTRDWMISVDALLRHETAPDQLVEDDEPSNVFGYYVQDADMATRTVHAWHDAIQTCTVKAVPKNLY